MTIDFALGTGLLSTDAHPLVRVTGLADTRALLDAYAQNGGNLIDSASIYPAIFKQAGKAQKMLGQVDAAAKSAYGFTVDSKVNSFVPGKGNRPEHIRECLEETIKDLKVNHVNVLYLHTVDHSTPLIDSIRAVDELFKEGKLKEVRSKHLHVESRALTGDCSSESPTSLLLASGRRLRLRARTT